MYNISTPLACLLSTFAFVLCGSWTVTPRALPSQRWPENDVSQISRPSPTLLDLVPFPRVKLDLHDLAKHGSLRIEHDGSLAHKDAMPGAKFAPITPDPSLVVDLTETSQAISLHAASGEMKYRGKNSTTDMTLEDVALARFNRNTTLETPLSAFHSRLALSECALLLSVMAKHPTNNSENAQKKPFVPRKWVKEWFGEERLPDDWVSPVHPVGLRTVGKVVKEVVAEVLQLQYSKEAAR